MRFDAELFMSEGGNYTPGSKRSDYSMKCFRRRYNSASMTKKLDIRKQIISGLRFVNSTEETR